MAKRLHLCLGLTLFIYATGSFVLAEAKQVKYGILTKNEIWEGQTYIIGDVTIPISMNVTINPGCIIYFSNYDIMQSGQNPEMSEIITYGSLKINSTKENPVLLKYLGKEQLLTLPEKTQQIIFSPYQIDTEPIYEEFRHFKNDYIAFWSFVYLISYIKLFW